MSEMRPLRAGSRAALRLLWLFGMRRMRADPWRTVLIVATVALGSATVYAALMLGSSLAARYDETSGLAHTAPRLEVVHAGGGGFPAEVRARIAAVDGVEAAVGIIDRPALATLDARTLRVTVIGADPALADGLLRRASIDLRHALGAYSAIVTPDLIDLESGDAQVIVRLQAGDRQVRLRIAGTMSDTEHPALGAGRMVVVPIALAQSLFGMAGQFTSVLVVPDPDHAGEAVVARAVAAALGPEFLVLPMTHRLRELRAATSTVQAFASFAAIVASATAAYLIFNVMTLSMARERRELGLMIAIGESKIRLALRSLAQAALIGVFGSAFGLGAGHVLGGFLLQSVPTALQGTSTSVLTAVIEVSDIALAAVIGPLVCMIGALAPAIACLRLQPADAMREQVPAHVGSRLPVAARALAGLGALTLLGVPGLRAFVDPGAVFMLGAAVCGALAMLPLTLAVLLGASGRALGSGPWPGRAGLRMIVGASVGADRYRCIGTMSAAALSIAALVAVGAAVRDVERAVAPFASALAGVDVYVASKDDPLLSVPLGREAVGLVSAVAGVAQVRTTASTFVWLRGTRVWVRGDDVVQYRDGRAVVRGMAPEEVSRALLAGNVLVSTQIAQRERLGPGDSIELITPSGPHAVRIAGVIDSWSWPGGTVVMDSARFGDAFGGAPPTQLSVAVHPGTRAQDVARAIAQHAGLDALTGVELGARVLEEVRATLAPFRILQAALVAMIAVAVFDALRLAVMHRRRSIGVLRAIGMSRLQVAALVIGEGVLMVAIAAVAGATLGVAIQHLGIGFVADATGLPLAASLDVGVLSGAVAAAFAAAALGSAMPAIAAARIEIVRAIGYE